MTTPPSGTPAATAGRQPGSVPPPSAPVERVPSRVALSMALAQFGLFVALLAPVTVSMAIKAQALFPADQAAAASATGTVLAVAALFAMVANPVFGRLSDLTLSRLGRRRPWMLGGAVVFVLALAGVAWAPGVGSLLAAWCLAQMAGNAILAPLLATIADQVPPTQRGVVASSVGVTQNVGILAAAFAASWFATDLVLLFLVPAALALVLVTAYCVVLPDRPIARRPELGGWSALARTFWVSPRQHPDFAWVWISRFLLTLAFFLFVTFRLFFLQREIGMDVQEATRVLSIGTLIFTATLAAAAVLGGTLSDRTRRRKPFVVGSTVLLGVGLTMLTQTTTVPAFYLAEVVMGLAYGVYVAVDYALVIDVLPRPDDAAKDLGVLNIANALPQSLAGALGAALIALSGSENYTLLFWVAGALALVGAVTIVPIRSVR